MKRIVIACLIALSLSACAGTPAGNLFQAVTVGTKNPITRDTLYAFENAMTIAFAGLGAYKKSCLAGAVPASCRTVITSLQVYTRKIPQALATVRGFVKNNDQVNAQTAYNTLLDLYNNFKTAATASGVQVQ